MTFYLHVLLVAIDNTGLRPSSVSGPSLALYAKSKTNSEPDKPFKSAIWEVHIKVFQPK